MSEWGFISEIIEVDHACYHQRRSLRMQKREEAIPEQQFLQFFFGDREPKYKMLKKMTYQFMN